MSDSVTITVLFFAKARELIGSSSGTAALPARCRYPALQAALSNAFPALNKLGHAFVLALNETYLDTEDGEEVELREGDELAVIPPISGG